MKLLHRSPREVYRIYDEEEFFADPTRELEIVAEGRSRLMVGVGALMLLAGVGVFGGLRASSRRVSHRGQAALRGEGRRVAGVIRARSEGVQSRPANKYHHGDPLRLPSATRSSRITRYGRRSHLSRTAVLPAAVSANDGVQAVSMVATTAVAAAPHAEFGFER